MSITDKLSKNRKRIDKIKRITIHYYETSKESTFPSSVSVVESDSDNDLVLCDERESESESDDDSHTVTIQEGTSTGSDRRVGHWPTRCADFVLFTQTLHEHLRFVPSKLFLLSLQSMLRGSSILK